MLHLRTYFLLLFLPLLTAILAFFLRVGAGPFWQYADPSYAYLYNALRMLKGLPPNLYEHPGTTLHVLILSVIKALNLGHPNAEAINNVFLNPEFYLHAVYLVLLALSLATSILLSLYVYHKTRDKLAVLLTQLPGLSFLVIRSFEDAHPAFTIASNVSPEFLLISCMNIFSIFFIKLFFSKTPNEENLSILCLAFVSGFGLATKLIFLPFALSAALVVPWRKKPLFGLVCLASFVLWTIPIISKYPLLFNLAKNMMTHSKLYGTGEKALLIWPLFIDHLRQILQEFWLFAVTTALLLVWGTVRFFRNRKERGIHFLLAASLSASIQYLLTAKHFSFHYLLGCIGMSSIIFLLFYLIRLNKSALIKKGLVVIIALCTLHFGGQALAQRSKMEQFTKDLNGLREKISMHYPNCRVIPARSVGSGVYLNQKHGIMYGNYYSAHAFNDELSALYPKELYFDSESLDSYYLIDGFGIRDFYGNRILADDLLTADSCYIFLKLTQDFSQYPYAVRKVEESKHASAYLLIGSTEKQANHLYLAATLAFNQGKYQEALLMALKSRQLNYHPRGKIDYFLNIVYHRLQNS